MRYDHRRRILRSVGEWVLQGKLCAYEYRNEAHGASSLQLHEYYEYAAAFSHTCIT